MSMGEGRVSSMSEGLNKQTLIKVTTRFKRDHPYQYYEISTDIVSWEYYS